MSSAFRAIVLWVACLFWCDVAPATPIVVVRTANGFMAGTNVTRGRGDQACKINYLGKKLLLVAGDPVILGTVLNGKLNILFDIDTELWDVMRPEFSDEQILEAASALIVSDIRKAASLFQPGPAPPAEFHLVLLSTDGSNPRAWTQRIKIPVNDITHMRIDSAEYPMQEGTTMVWIGSDNPKTFPKYLDHDNLLKVLEQMAIDAKSPTDHGFEPPFVILTLDAAGLKDLNGNLGPCISSHPLPTLSQDKPKK